MLIFKAFHFKKPATFFPIGKVLFTCLLGPLLFYLVAGCEPKEDIITTNPKAALEFSTDSVKFDTVFVSTGSISQAVWVYNRNAKAVKINEVKLTNANPVYQLIIDGQATNQVQNILLRGKDSLLVLVKVTIPPSSDSIPFLQQDVLSFLTNSNRQEVPLITYGENAYFHKKEEITANTTWSADKPHVVFDFVRIAPNVTLTIEKGTRVYFHKEAALLVNGQLKVNGTAEKRVQFAGDRRERYYADVPGQWQGIKFEGTSSNNDIRFAEIKNATYGLWANNPDQDEADYDLTINQTIIQNMFETGIVSSGADVQAVNTLIANCGKSAVLGKGGGNFDFTYCTLANYTLGFRPETTTLSFSDRLRTEAGQNQDYRIKLNLQNSIIWAGKRSSSRFQDQILFINEAGTTPQLQISHSVLQTEGYKEVEASTCCNNAINVDPKFKSTLESLETTGTNFRLDTLSPVSNSARPVPAVLKDLEDKLRNPVTPDPGAYERTNP